MSRERRERELLRITKENQDILKRIMSKKPDISTSSLKRDWDQNVRFLNNISAFPEEWYSKRDEKSVSARSGVSAGVIKSEAKANENDTSNTNINNSNNKQTLNKQKPATATGTNRDAKKKDDKKEYTDDFDKE